MGWEWNILQYVAGKTTNICAPIDAVAEDPDKRKKKRPSDNGHEEQQSTFQQNLPQDLEQTQQPIYASTKATNVINETAARTEAAIHATFNSTTPVSNENQRPNDFTGSSQCTAPQVAQPVDPQGNNDDDDGDDYNSLLPHNLYADSFENVANCNDFLKHK